MKILPNVTLDRSTFHPFFEETSRVYLVANVSIRVEISYEKKKKKKK